MTHAADLGKEPVKDEDAAIEFDERVMEILPKVHEQLYTILCGITEGEAFDIVNASPAGKGLESYRRLCHRFDPMTEGRRANMWRSITNPEKLKLEDLAGGIEIWEESVRKFESRRGLDGDRKKLDDDLKYPLLVQMCPDNLRTHIETVQGPGLERPGPQRHGPQQHAQEPEAIRKLWQSWSQQGQLLGSRRRCTPSREPRDPLHAVSKSWRKRRTGWKRKMGKRTLTTNSPLFGHNGHTLRRPFH